MDTVAFCGGSYLLIAALIFASVTFDMWRERERNTLQRLAIRGVLVLTWPLALAWPYLLTCRAWWRQDKGESDATN